jgi:serine/threonine-protein kinase
VHRDVKPDNVFLVRREGGGERAKILDFGISHVPAARGAERITRAGALIGTPEYMAPEQATGAEVDARSDVYAAGVLAYEMLTGTLPIAEESPIATLVAHQTRAPEPPSARVPAIPAAVDALVLRALAKRREDRFPSMEAFGAEVARVRAAVARARGTDPGGTPRRPSDTLALEGLGATEGRGRRSAALGAAALVAVVAGAVVAAWSLSRAEPLPRIEPAVAAPAPPAADAPLPAAAPAPRAEDGAPPAPARPEAPRSARRRPPPASPARPTSSRIRTPAPPR